nr:MAG TPA: hypothetical protein [Caudoviricetes sp.]
MWRPRLPACDDRPVVALPRTRLLRPLRLGSTVPTRGQQ